MIDASKETISERWFLISQPEKAWQWKDAIDVAGLCDYLDEKGKISEDILDITIQDPDGKYYTIIKPELDFLNKYDLPVPTIHWLSRIEKHMGNLKL